MRRLTNHKLSEALEAADGDIARMGRSLTRLLNGASVPALAIVSAAAMSTGASAADPATPLLTPLNIALLTTIGVGVLGAAIAFAFRVSGAARSASAVWSRRLAEMEARLEKAEGVLAAHPGLVLVWEDDDASIATGWGSPRILGGPAALASLMTFARDDSRADASPVDRLLESLGDLPVDDDGPSGEISRLRDKIRDLRAHGVAFYGAIRTSEGRAIEVDGRVAGGQVALWLTDPAARLAEDGGIMGKVRERTADLHGAFSQLERAPVPAWRRGADLSLTWVNAAYVEAVEAAGPSAVLKDQIELDPSARRIAEKAASERRTVEGRITLNVRGVRRAFRVLESPMHGAGEASIAGFAIDVTDLERARVELKQHIDANRRTLDQVPTAVALFGVNQELAFYNAAFQQLWALDDAELAARPSHSELMDRLRQAGRLPERADFSAWKRQQLQLYTEETPGVEAAREGQAPDEIWNLPDGRTLRVARARHPLGGVIVVFDDITERMRLEAMFKTQLNVQRATLNNLAEGVAVFGADGLLRLHNVAFERLWRLDEAMLSQRPHIEKVMTAMAGRVSSGGELLTSIKRRATSMSPDERKPISQAFLSLADGRTLAFGTEPLPDGATLAHFLDVTDSREREKELKQRNELLEDIYRQKSRFADHVSYQLRTPLATIIGFAEMLDGPMFGTLNDRQKDYIANILTAGYQLKDLISDIMDLSAIDQGRLTIERENVDLKELLTSAATFSALKAEDTQISLRVDCPRDIGSVSADPLRLKQILFNLLSNAFAYTGAGGSVTLGVDRGPGVVRLWVEDTGRGLSPGDQAKAFESFEASGPSAGAGLGLALVQRLVALHGGWVRLASEPGKGTKVTCFIPDAASAAAAPGGGASRPTSARRKPQAGSSRETAKGAAPETSGAPEASVPRGRAMRRAAPHAGAAE